MHEEPLRSAWEECELLRVKLPTLRLWTRTTDIPRLYLGRLVRYRHSDVMRWLEARQSPRPRS
jgi:excisionase family DNA binding protein